MEPKYTYQKYQEEASSIQGNFDHAVKVREKLEEALRKLLVDIEENNSLIKSLRREADALHFKLEE